jgi:hypothetical protein
MFRLAAGLLFLILIFLPAPAASGRWPVLDRAVPFEALALAAVIALPALRRGRWPKAVRAVLAILGLAAAVIGFADAEAPALMGRDLDFSADLAHAGSVIALLAASASPVQIVLATLAACLVPVLLFLAMQAALGAVERGLDAAPRRAAALLAAAILVAALSGSEVVSHRAIAAIEKQRGKLADAWRATHGERDQFLAGLGPPPRTDGDLARLGGRDVYVIFIESYGAVLLDAPEFKPRAAAALARFDTAVAGAGFTLRSARIASPTYGGGSWLAHGTVDSGAWLDSELRYELLTTTDRPTWPRLMAKAGYQTMDALPGLKEPLDSAAFWGFDHMVGTDQLGYSGPSFGWFGVPDQFALGAIAALPRAAGKPLFVQIVLVSSHMPFSPLPPYVEDWSDAGRFASHPEVARTLETPPDWQNLAAPYLDSVDYDLRVLGDWIPRTVRGNALVIILGDHQPPALIGTASASHDVPIHVLSRDPEIVRAVAGPGYADGALPGGSAGNMADLLPNFLERLSSPQASAKPQTGATAPRQPG